MPRMLRELLGEALGNEPGVEIVGECSPEEFAREWLDPETVRAACGDRPLVAVAGDERRLVLERVHPVGVRLADVSPGDVAAAIGRLAAGADGEEELART